MELFFVSPAALWALLGLPLLVLANWLSGRYRTQTVPNLMLWRQLTQEVARSHQRSRHVRRLKLLLEVLLLSLIAIGAGGPQLRRTTQAPRRIAIILESDLPMRTRLDEGQRAWDAGRRAARALIAQLDPADQVALRLTGSPDSPTAAWLAPAAADEALQQARTGRRVVRSEPQVRGALALGPDVTVYQIGLGPHGPEQPRLVRIGVGQPRSDNLGWIGFHAGQEVGQNGATLLGVLASADTRTRRRRVRLTSDGTTLARQTVAVPPLGRAEVRFSGLNLGRTLQLSIEGGDCLPDDDIVRAQRAPGVRLDVQPAGKLRGLAVLRQLLPELDDGAPAERTLHIRLGMAPEQPLPLPLVLLSPTASQQWEIHPAPQPGGFGRLAQDPLLAGLDLSLVAVRQAVRIERAPVALHPIAWAIGQATPLIYRGDRLILLAFWPGLPGSNWENDPSFPIFWRRAIRQFYPDAGAYTAPLSGIVAADNRGWGTRTLPRIVARTELQLTTRDLRLPTALLAVFLLLAYAGLRGKTKRKA